MKKITPIIKSIPKRRIQSNNVVGPPPQTDELKYVYELALEKVTDSVKQQKEDLRNFRNQATVIVGANGIVASLLADKIFNRVNSDDHFWEIIGPSGAIGTFLFFFSLYASAKIIWPKQNWIFDIDAVKFVNATKNSKQQNLSLVALKKLVTQQLSAFENNESLFEDEHVYLKCAIFSVFMQIPFWCLEFIQGK